MRQGPGIELYYNKQMKYKGNFKNDNYDGTGLQIQNINNVPEFEGDIKEGQYVKGKQLFNNGKLFYEGTFKENLPHGDKCVTYYQNGTIQYKVINFVYLI